MRYNRIEYKSIPMYFPRFYIFPNSLIIRIAISRIMSRTTIVGYIVVIVFITPTSLDVFYAAFPESVLFRNPRITYGWFQFS